MALGKALKRLLVSLTNAAVVASKGPEAVGELFDKLSAIEGAAANLRGPLFEMIVGHCVRKKEGNIIDIGREVVNPEAGKKAEIDVFRVKEDLEVGCYECKAHGSNVRVTRDEVVHWVTQTVPTIRGFLKAQERFQNVTQKFEFWTTGRFEPDAIDYLQEVKTRTKKYELVWRDQDGVVDYVKAAKVRYFIRILNEHYFKHPLNKSEKSVVNTHANPETIVHKKAS